MNIMVLVSITTVHTYVFVQKDGRDNIVKMVIKLHYIKQLNRKSFVHVQFKNTIATYVIVNTDMDECQLTDLCKHNGTCINNNGSYICNCEVGWQGQHCEDGKLHEFIFIFHCHNSIGNWIGFSFI